MTDSLDNKVRDVVNPRKVDDKMSSNKTAGAAGHSKTPTQGQFRLPNSSGSWVDHDTPIEFNFCGKTFYGFAGDTIASALIANGQWLLSRSFKYHRARGALTMAGQDGNTLVSVPGNPHALADRYLIHDQLIVEAINTSGSLERDRGRHISKFARFLPVGFYYKAFFKPKGMWEQWVKLIRRVAGLGVIDQQYTASNYQKRYKFCDVLVVGGGPAGLCAALTIAADGASVLLVDENPHLGGALNYTRSSDKDNPEHSAEHLVSKVLINERIEVLTSAVCNGWFADNWLPIIRGKSLYKVRAKQCVLATGALEQPAIFHNNDLPGIIMSSAAQRLMRQYDVRPGSCAAVLLANDIGFETVIDLHNHGVKVAAVIDLRDSALSDAQLAWLNQASIDVFQGSAVYAAKASKRATHIKSIEVRKITARGLCAQQGQVVQCDVLCMAVGYTPTYQLACQAGAELHYNDDSATFTISNLPGSMHLAGTVNGVWVHEAVCADGRRAGTQALLGLINRSEQVPTVDDKQVSPNFPWPIFSHPKGKEFVDLDEDLQINDLIHATLDGFDDIQLVKRYSTCGMGPSQGRTSALAAARIVADVTHKTVAETGVTTARPPFAAETLAHSAGRSYFPFRRTSMHHRHIEAGAQFMPAGLWQRPAYYGDASERGHAIQNEARSVRQNVGLIDVSTLGGLEIRGRDAAEFINRIYTWNFLNQKNLTARYALMTNEAGVVIDDGVACRLAEHHYYVTATTSGVDNVYRTMLKWNAQWRLQVDIANVTSSWCAVNLAGPNSRLVLQRLATDIDIDAQSFPYMAIRQGHINQIPVRVLRVGFVGELGFEIHAPQHCGEALWDSLMKAGRKTNIKPFGVEAQRILRLEKGHIIIGQDTDAMTNPFEVKMRWAVAKNKAFFVGQRMLTDIERYNKQRKLIGFRLSEDETTLPLESHLVLKDNHMIGRVTSCAQSVSLQCAVGMALVPSEYSEDTIVIKCDGGKLVSAQVCSVPFYDADNQRQALP